MTLHHSGRLAVHRRSDEVAFLQSRLRTLKAVLQDDRARRIKGKDQTFDDDERALRLDILRRERDLADELLHTRQIEPLGETLQRRLAMAERICRDLARPESTDQRAPADPRRMAKIERRALAEMLNQWWAWLRGLD